ncbi:Pkinase-domain-containing protein [Mollisia scopiformis]|uniref:cyclin-dependent kinase n=1 Tax=Mollisia scopiformis TaxID=149040 RepID=A0A194XAQ6_MOLSC|nr:Pkinase-domain-containing protein [Mollisia scopiformis]KUJ17260.1 Pkinase-domain-containing protein [Mollisia scopiformis]
MKDSWSSHGDDRRDRGRVDRGVTRPRRSRSPISRRPDSDRDPKTRDRSPLKSRPAQHTERPRDRSHERSRRRLSRSPLRDSREEVRERNRGRELLDTRGSDKPKRSSVHHSPSSGKRRKSHSPSPPRSHTKKSKRDTSRSPSRLEGSVTSNSRTGRKRHIVSPAPSRRRSSERRPVDSRAGDKYNKHHRGSRVSESRGRSPSPKQDRHYSSSRQESRRPQDSTTRYPRSPTRHTKPSERSPTEKPRGKDREERRPRSPNSRQRSPDVDRYEPSNRTRQRSPAPGGPKGSRGHSPTRDREGRPPRDEYRPGKPKGKTAKSPFQSASGANSIEVKNSRAPAAASGANSIEVKSDKMAGRGYYGGQQGYNPNQQMQAAFPLKPQYNQGPQVDLRQYSQSPQHHMTPNSFHSSPQAQSPYSAGRGGWGGPQYSPQPQYPQNYQHQQPAYSAPTGPQGHYYNSQAQSPPYQAPTGPMNTTYNPQQNFRGNQRAFRGNHFNPRGGRGDHRGGRGGHYQNLHWNATGGSTGAGRGQNTSGNATPQQSSPQQYQQQAGSHESTPQYNAPPEEEEEDADDLFRPSKDLQVEDKEATKKGDDEQMPPPSRPPPTGPQSQQNSSKFSFAFKASSKATPTPPKPEISQKLNAGPARNLQISQDRPRGPNSRNVPTEPASARRQDFRTEPPAPTTRKVKKLMRRLKPRPQLEPDFKASESVYYRKPGNESVVGSGTYGKVFKGIHVYTKKLVALKKIRMEGERDGFPITAVREIKLLQSLKHHNIVNLQEVMVEKNDCFMVFEYLSHDLTGLLNHPTFKLEPAHKKHLAKQLFEGLDYLHRRGVLHRDIKAANILVSGQGLLKIADFGLARFYAKRRQLDYTNRVITIWYRSPELLLGETQYGPAVDIWSAACVLVEIFTRHAIFPGDGGEISQLEKIYAIMGTPNKTDWPGLVDMAWFELLRPNARRPNVFAEKYKDRLSPAAFELLEVMFAYDPANRPSASDVLEHPYFRTEDPQPKQAVELSKLDGDWHEFESKALRKENERKDKESRRLQKEAATLKAEKEKKRGLEGDITQSDAKRVQMAPPSASASQAENAK